MRTAALSTIAYFFSSHVRTLASYIGKPNLQPQTRPERTVSI
jgi:hypothetical protein